MQDTIYLYYSILATIFLYIDCLFLPVQNLISATHIQITLQNAYFIYRDSTRLTKYKSNQLKR